MRKISNRRRNLLMMSMGEDMINMGRKKNKMSSLSRLTFLAYLRRYPKSKTKELKTSTGILMPAPSPRRLNK